MKRVVLPIIGVFAAIFPILLRVISGNPAFSGTAPYQLLLFSEEFLSTGLATALLISFGASLLFFTLFFAINVLRLNQFTKDSVEITLALVIASPFFLGAIVSAPINALILFLVFGSWWCFQRGRLLVGWCGVIFVASLIILEFATIGFVPQFVEFGRLGYGMFTLVAALVGAAVLWENKARNYFLALGVITLIVASFFIPALLSLGSIAVAIVGGMGLFRLWKRRWVYGSVRMLSLVLFGCGVLFSSISAAVLIQHAAPDGSLASDLSALRYVLPDGKVVSAPENSVWIAHWAAHDALEFTPDEYALLWNSRNFTSATVLLKGNVSSIIITKDMRETLWSDDEDGLLFILQNSKTFKRVGDGNSVDAWALQ